MNRMVFRAALTATLLMSGAALAQSGRNYDIKPMNFDLWCQETAKIAPDRCDKHMPEDVAAFEAYSDKIAAYEIPDLQRRNKDARVDTDILHGDPVDRSATRTMQAQQQQTNQAPVLPQSVP